MTSADEPMKAYYAARAPYYDDVYEKPARREDIAFLRDHLPAAFAQRQVLEVACGTGYWTQFIAPAAAAMTATDAVAEPLDLARGRPARASSSWTTRTSSAASFPSQSAMRKGTPTSTAS